MKWTGKIILSVAIVATLALLTIAFLPKPVGVEAAPVERGAFEQTVDEEGKTRVRERYSVSAPLSGYLLRIGLEAGDPVKQNQLLAEIVPSPPSLLDVRTERELRERLGAADAERLRAIAAVERAKAALDQAKADLKRTRQLSKEGLAPPAQLERDELSVTLRIRELAAARFENEVAEPQVELARAALLQARKGPGANHVGEKFEIRSPVPGRVLRVLQESEGSVQTGTPLLEIADPADLEVVADVLTTDAVQIRPGMAVRIDRYGANLPLAGRIRLVEPSAFTKVSALGVEEQRVNVVVDFTSPYEEWKNLGDGYRVEVKIVVFSAENAVKVPAGALFREGEGWALFTLSEGRAQKRPVRISRWSGAEAMIESGLEPGLQVIVYPSDAVKDGVRVKLR